MLQVICYMLLDITSAFSIFVIRYYYEGAAVAVAGRDSDDHISDGQGRRRGGGSGPGQAGVKGQRRREGSGGTSEEEWPIVWPTSRSLPCYSHPTFMTVMPSQSAGPSYGQEDPYCYVLYV